MDLFCNSLTDLSSLIYFPWSWIQWKYFWKHHNAGADIDLYYISRTKGLSHGMMTSSNGHIFRVTGPLCGEFTGNSPHKGQWHGALMFSLICAWINDWVNNREAGDLRRHRAHYDVRVMKFVNGHTEIPQWPFLSVPVRAFERGCTLNYPKKRFKLHLRLHRPNRCQNFRSCMRIMDVKFLSTVWIMDVKFLSTESGAKPILERSVEGALVIFESHSAHINQNLWKCSIYPTDKESLILKLFDACKIHLITTERWPCASNPVIMSE